MQHYVNEGLFSELSPPSFLHPTPVLPTFKPFSTLHQSQHPQSTSKAFLWLHDALYHGIQDPPSSLCWPLWPHVQVHPHFQQHVPGMSFSLAPQQATFSQSCAFMCGCLLPVVLFLSIKQSAIHLLFSDPQETFPDLLKSSLDGFLHACLVHWTSAIRGSASYMTATLVVHYAHHQHSGWYIVVPNRTKLGIDLEEHGIKVQFPKNKQIICLSDLVDVRESSLTVSPLLSALWSQFDVWPAYHILTGLI